MCRRRSASLAAHLNSVSLLINRATGRALDSNEYGDAIPQNGGAYQKWYIYDDGDTFDLTNAQTGRVLDSNQDGEVYTLPNNDGHHQRWRMHGYFVQNVATGLYLNTDDNDLVYAVDPNADGYLHWQPHHEVKF